MNNRVFISYSHYDREWLERFQTMLKPLMRNDSLMLWDDTRLKTGSKWREEIAKNLELAGIALLLVSKDFLASEFINNNELPILLKAAEKKGLTIIWVSIGACLYQQTEIVNYQAANDPSTPLNAMGPGRLDQEMVNICNKIVDMIKVKPPVAQEAILSVNGDGQISDEKNIVIPKNAPRTDKGGGLKIAILYKRGSQPDETILELIEDHFTEKGHSIFIDRHLTIGIKWAEEIEQQLKSSDVVIPLLSSASITSEMLNFEIETAQDTAQKTGKPRILPVRIRYEDQLQGSLGNILNPLQYALWNDPADNDKVLAQLEAGIRGPMTSTAVRTDPPGGAVPIDSKFYIVRNTDFKLLQAISHQDSIILIKGARQTGKTSLLARGLLEAKKMDYKVIVTDLQKLNNSSLENIESFYLALGSIIADQLGLDKYPASTWNASSTPNLNFENYIKNVVLKSTSQPIAWGMDEVDRLFTTDYGSEVFGLFRSWFNERAFLDTPFERVSLLIVYALEAHLFITDPYQSPFNVGTKLEMKDFSRDQVADLNVRHGNCLRNEKEFGEFYQLLGGHPYLIRKGLHVLSGGDIKFEPFIATAATDEGPFGDHLRRILVMLARKEELWNSIREVLNSNKCSSVESFYRLRTAGIVSGDTEQQVRFRCQIYETYLKHHLPAIESELHQ